ncbi:hypothetical protein [Paraburkholderia panacisoli]|jgi:hypothetical protein|uniref:hypothetical protein n=1 Tax=Paraburkholderia panacisoli TaxID=2603818 RepID=UPI00165F46DA|nr:hypothetical protein [Paraburkholderia panacisoli]
MTFAHLLESFIDARRAPRCRRLVFALCSPIRAFEETPLPRSAPRFEVSPLTES